MNYWARLLLLSSCLLNSSCVAIYGTFIEPQANSIYIGTRKDAEIILGIVSEVDGPSTIHGGGLYGLLFLPIFLIDLPFSLVADTAFLPYTVVTLDESVKAEAR